MQKGRKTVWKALKVRWYG